MILVGITSYMGANQIVIQKRLEAHRKQLLWFLANFSDYCRIHIIAQEYQNDWYMESQNITYHKVGKRLSVGDARNQLLEFFYDSNYDWMLLFDNDSIFYTHMMGNMIIQHMSAYPELYEGIDLWYPINPRYEPFKKIWMERKEVYEAFIVFDKPDLTINTSIFAVKNLMTNTSIQDPMFFSSEDKSNLETADFMLSCMASDYKVYKCSSVVSNEMINTERYTTKYWNESYPQRLLNINKVKRNLVDKYQYAGLSGRMNKSEAVIFSGKNFWEKLKYPFPLIIERRDYIDTSHQEDEQQNVAEEPKERRKRERISLRQRIEI